MKLRYLAVLPAVVAVAAAVAPGPRRGGRLLEDGRPDTTLCLKTGGWTEITGTDRRTTHHRHQGPGPDPR